MSRVFLRYTVCRHIFCTPVLLGTTALDALDWKETLWAEMCRLSKHGISGFLTGSLSPYLGWKDWHKKWKHLAWIICDSSASTAEQWGRCSAGKQQGSSDCLPEVALSPWKSPSRKEGTEKKWAKTFSHRPRIWKNERKYAVLSKVKGSLERCEKGEHDREKPELAVPWKGTCKEKFPGMLKTSKDGVVRICTRILQPNAVSPLVAKSGWNCFVFLVKQHPGSSQHNPVPSSLLLLDLTHSSCCRGSEMLWTLWLSSLNALSWGVRLKTKGCREGTFG